MCYELGNCNPTFVKFFTADHHYHHLNSKGTGIIDYAQRPFVSIVDMHVQLIERWNLRVKRKDEVYVLGDFALARADRVERLLLQLHGRIKIVPGGHDARWLKEMGFKINKGDTGMLLAPLNHVEILPMLYMLRMNKNLGVPRSIILCHYPLFTWQESHHGSWHFHGHSHIRESKDHTYRRIMKPIKSSLTGKSIDVGVDAWDFYPVSLPEIVKKLGGK